MKYNPACFSGIYVKPTAYDGTTTPGTQPWKNMTIMVDTSDIDDDNYMSYKYIISIIYIWMSSLIHTAPYIAKKIKNVTKRTNYILKYSRQNMPNKHLRTHLEFFTVCVHCKWANLHDYDLW